MAESDRTEQFLAWTWIMRDLQASRMLQKRTMETIRFLLCLYGVPETEEIVEILKAYHKWLGETTLFPSTDEKE